MTFRNAASALAFCALVTTTPALAETPPTDLMRGLAGEWQGAFAYRDYQTDERTELPLNATITIGPDGHTLHQVSRYGEGVGRADVFIVSTSAFSDGGRVYETAGFRSGRSMAVSRETVDDVTVNDATHWTIVFTERSEDNDRPAAIRVTLTRAGDTLTSLKEVDDLTDGEEAFAFRNETTLRRVDASGAALR